MINEIYIIDDDETSIIVFRELFKDDKDYKFINVRTEEIDIALENIPLLIIINEDAVDADVFELCKKIKNNPDNTITPVIVVSSNRSRKHRMQILNEAVEYYIRKPVDEGYLYYTVKNITRLLILNRRMSPLTGLPGNVQIQSELRKHLLKKEDFSVIYFDLDNFKAYNDVYGFLKGDEIIKFTSNIILNVVHNNGNGFVGHIGGDDFIAILPNNNLESICMDIIAKFDYNIKKFYTDKDAENGYIEVANRKGIIEKFPLVSISIAVVVDENRRFNNILEIGDVAAQVKHAVKSIMGSSYTIDRRKN